MKCPLCHGPLHRKSGDTWTECAWRQFCEEAQLLERDGRPPLMREPDLIHDYADWLAANLDTEHTYMGYVFSGLLAGSTDANRLLRQKSRGAI